VTSITSRLRGVVAGRGWICAVAVVKKNKRKIIMLKERQKSQVRKLYLFSDLGSALIIDKKNMF
jgi:hypothetical protein